MTCSTASATNTQQRHCSTLKSAEYKSPCMFLISSVHTQLCKITIWLLCIIFLILHYSFTYHVDLPIEMRNNVIHVRILRKSYQCVIQVFLNVIRDFEEIIVAQGNVSQNFSFRYLHLHGMQYKCVRLDMRYM